MTNTDRSPQTLPRSQKPLRIVPRSREYVTPTRIQNRGFSALETTLPEVKNAAVPSSLLSSLFFFFFETGAMPGKTLGDFPESSSHDAAWHGPWVGAHRDVIKKHVLARSLAPTRDKNGATDDCVEAEASVRWLIQCGFHEPLG